MSPTPDWPAAPRNPGSPIKLSIVMPIFNEAAHLEANVEQTLETIRLLATSEVILADDGSSDASSQIVHRLAARFPREVRAFNLPHQGKGAAVRHGVLQAQGEWVALLDADLDLPPEQVLFFIAMQRAKNADAVIGSKMHPDSTVGYPLIRRIYSWGYFILVKFLFGLPVRDTQTGLKLVRRDLLVSALERTKNQGFAFDLEVLIHLVQLKAVLVEAPVVVRHSLKFKGIGIGTAWTIFFDTMKIWWRLRGVRRS